MTQSICGVGTNCNKVLKCLLNFFFLPSRCGLRTSSGNVVRRDLLLRPHRHHALLLFLVIPGCSAMDGVRHELDVCRQLLQQQCRYQLDIVQHFRTQIIV